MSQNFEDVMKACYRYAILDFLGRRDTRRSNSQIVLLWFDHLSAPITLSTLTRHADWLHERNLIDVYPLTERLNGYTLTPRGQEVLDGLTRIPGISAPTNGYIA